MKIQRGLTFDDVLLKPLYSEVHPTNTNTQTKLTRNISLNIPIISAAMDTVTESRLSIALAQLGGIGCIHKNLSIERQAEEVRKVKKFESVIVYDPIIINHTDPISLAIKLMKEQSISGIPVIGDDNLLVGIITNRDVRGIKYENYNCEVAQFMTKNNLIVVKEHIEKSEAVELLNKHKIERLIVVNEKYECIGLITLKDIQKSIQFPNAAKDSKGRLLVSAAVGVAHDVLQRVEALVEVGIDVIVVDTAHGHSKGVVDIIKLLKNKFPKLDIIAGNIATKEGATCLIEAGVDAIKVGIGPGSICTTRIIAGVGYPQLSAIMEVYEKAKQHNIPVIADGGMKFSGDIVKALAAGASVVMLGGMFAGTEETPGDVIFYQGRSYKSYRGMGSIGAMARGSADRYFQEDIKDKLKLVPEGIEGRVPFKGQLINVVHQILGGIKAGMGYTGCGNINEMHIKCEFVEITSAALKESHPHNIDITNAAPNYGITT